MKSLLLIFQCFFFSFLLIFRSEFRYVPQGFDRPDPRRYESICGGRGVVRGVPGRGGPRVLLDPPPVLRREQRGGHRLHGGDAQEEGLQLEEGGTVPQVDQPKDRQPLISNDRKSSY